jgi:uncharacterized membrane protein
MESVSSKWVQRVSEEEKNMIWVSVIIIISGSKIDDGDDNTVGDCDNDHIDFDKEIITINVIVVVVMIVQCSSYLETNFSQRFSYIS